MMCITHLARDYGSGSKGTQRTEAFVGFRLGKKFYSLSSGTVPAISKEVEKKGKAYKRRR